MAHYHIFSCIVPPAVKIYGGLKDEQVNDLITELKSRNVTDLTVYATMATSIYERDTVIRKLNKLFNVLNQ